MTLSAMLHTGLVVHDLDRSLSFYVGLLRLRVVHSQTGDNEYTRTLVGIPDASLKAVLLQTGDGDFGSVHILELIEYIHPKGDRIRSNPNNVAAAHLAFEVNDCHELYERLAAAGVEFVNPPVAITAGINKGGHACYLRDPDGFILEFLQPPARREAS